MKALISFTLVQVAVVLALMLWRPTHRETQRPTKDLSTSPMATANSGSFISLPSPDSHRRNIDPASDSITTVSANRNYRFSAAIYPAATYQSDVSLAPAPAVMTAGRIAGGGRSRDVNRRTPTEVSVLPVPTAQQMEQTLAVPLAFLEPPAEAGLTGSEVEGLAQIGKQFNATVSAAGQDPADPAYAETYYDARNLADEQVWAVSGQAAYTALINQRAQAAGNVTPGQ